MTDCAQDYQFSSLNFYRENHGQQLYYNWSGKIWWVPEPGADSTLLFHIIGMNATKVLLKTDPDEGEIGYRLNRELGLYCHPETDEILTHWTNPHGEKVSVVHIANRMVQGGLKEKIITIPKGKEYIAKVTEFPLVYPHPLAKEERFRDYCPGEKFKGHEYFTSHFKRPNVTQVPPATWDRDCPWLPWMKMGFEHPARLRFETTIQRVEQFEDLHPNLVNLIRDRVPLYEFTPEHCDEANMTSLTYFKQHFTDYQQGKSFPRPEAP